jgi:hypothetical protein
VLPASDLEPLDPADALGRRWRKDRPGFWHALSPLGTPAPDVDRVCLYTRISTDEENQPTSLHSQNDRLEAFCTSQEDWRIVAHHEDRATGTKLDRPGLQASLDSRDVEAQTCCLSTASPRPWFARRPLQWAILGSNQ